MFHEIVQFVLGIEFFVPLTYMFQVCVSLEHFQLEKIYLKDSSNPSQVCSYFQDFAIINLDARFMTYIFCTSNFPKSKVMASFYILLHASRSN